MRVKCSVPKGAVVQEQLERRILKGLACEWDNAASLLDAADCRGFTKPLFSLHDMKTRLGCWSLAKKEITLSRKLVLNHTWNDVREVLLHEMAHQYADEVLNAGSERPHGPAFQSACRLLNADPAAAHHFQPLLQRLDRSLAAKDRLLQRIQKLMSLAESRNPHEADAALQKAQELTRKYNVDQRAVNAERRFISIFLGAPALRHRRDDYLLAHLLQTHYFIQGIWVSAYVLQKEKMGRVLEISGTPRNVKVAGYVFDFMRHTIDARWRRYNRERGLNRYRRTDFACGLLQGFMDQLNANEKALQPQAAGRAVVRIQDPALQRYLADRYPRTAAIRRRAGRHNPRIVNDGYHVGSRLVLSKGVAYDGGSGRRLTQ